MGTVLAVLGRLVVEEDLKGWRWRIRRNCAKWMKSSSYTEQPLRMISITAVTCKKTPEKWTFTGFVYKVPYFAQNILTDSGLVCAESVSLLRDRKTTLDKRWQDSPPVRRHYHSPSNSKHIITPQRRLRLTLISHMRGQYVDALSCVSEALCQLQDVPHITQNSIWQEVRLHHWGAAATTSEFISEVQPSIQTLNVAFI